MSRLKGKPFEIVAVSVDDQREILAEMVRSKRIPGINTWDEGGSENPVAELYNIRSLPTWYLIDDKGVIRARDPFGDKLIVAVETLFASRSRSGE